MMTKIERQANVYQVNKNNSVLWRQRKQSDGSLYSLFLLIVNFLFFCMRTWKSGFVPTGKRKMKMKVGNTTISMVPTSFK